jgi:EmrB/QacA subfamily drug resistance transporter
MDAETTAERPPALRWALASLALAMLLSSLGTSIANVGLPTLAHAFNASFQQVQWVVLAYLLAITSLVVSVGRLGDLAGRRRLLLAGIFLFTVASAACGIATTLGLLIAARAVQGAGAAVMMALAMAMVSETVPKARTGSAMGLLGTMSALGTALGPSLGGMLIDALGWRAIFLLNVPLGMLALLLAWRCLPLDRALASADPVRFDHLGTLLLAFALVAYALSMTVGHGRIGPLNAALLLAALIGAALFVYVEGRVQFPLLRLAMFRDAAFSASLAASVLVMTVMMSTLVVGPFYLSRGHGLAPAMTGLVMAAGPVVSVLAGVPAGLLADRFGARRIGMIGLIVLLAGCFCLSILPVRLGVLAYLGALVVMTAGYALFQAANNTAVMAAVRPDERGVVSGMLSLGRNLGLLSGASLMGAVFAAGTGTAALMTARPEAIATGMQLTFAVAALLIAAALAIATVGLAFRRTAKNQAAQ